MNRVNVKSTLLAAIALLAASGMLVPAGTRAGEAAGAEPPPAPSLYAMYHWTGEYVRFSEQIRQTGVRWVRQGGWGDVKRTDQAMLVAAKNETHLVPCIGELGKIESREQVAAVVQQAADAARANVKRYGPGGTFWQEHPEVKPVPIRYWQIMNEPNIEYLSPPEGMTRPELYAVALKEIGQAIREVDPGATVIAFNTAGGAPYGGSGPPVDGFWEKTKYYGWRRFIRDVNAHLVDLSCYDAVGTHPYTQPRAPDDEKGVLAGLAMLQELAEEQKFADKPVWFTEVGFALQYPKNLQVRDERQQACFTARLFALAAARGVTQVQIMSITDVHMRDGTFRQFGIFTEDGKWREQAVAMRVMIRLMPEPRPGAKIVAEEKGGVFAYELPGATGQPVLMAWHTGEGQVEREFPAAVGPLALVDMLGKTSELKAVGGKLKLTLGEAPVYVVRGSPAEVDQVLGQLHRE